MGGQDGRWGWDRAEEEDCWGETDGVGVRGCDRPQLKGKGDTDNEEEGRNMALVGTCTNTKHKKNSHDQKETTDGVGPAFALGELPTMDWFFCLQDKKHSQVVSWLASTPLINHLPTSRRRGLDIDPNEKGRFKMFQMPLSFFPPNLNLWCKHNTRDKHAAICLTT